MSPQYRRSRKAKSSRSSKKRNSRGRRKAKRSAADRQLVLDPQELVQMAQDSIHSFAVEVGLLIAGRLLEDEVERLCGPRYRHDQARSMSRHGKQSGVVTLAGQKVSIQRPRVRYRDGSGEVDLENYGLLQRDGAMPESVLRRMVCGVSCRDYEAVVDLAQDGFGVKKSSVSRGFVRASAESIQALAERQFDDVRFAAVMIDGVNYAGEMMVVAIGIADDGYKRVLGLRQGATENAEVVTSLLEDLRDRGLASDQPLLFVLDGAKALQAGVKRVWGRKAIIQRCQVHKKRNVMAHVPVDHAEEIEGDLHDAWAEKNYGAAEAKLKRLVKRLRYIAPDASKSLSEGLLETITVIKLQVPPLLMKTLKSTNPIESALDVVSTMTRRVKRWRDGDMRLRWCSAGLLRAEQKFRRVRGYKQIPQLLASLDAQLLDTKRKAC